MFKSPELMRQELDAAGLPRNIEIDSNITDPEIKRRYRAISDLMVSGVQVVQVFGLASPTKELVCAKLMRRYMFKREKTGRWLTPARISAVIGEYPKSAGVICLYGIDKLSIPKIANVSDIIREWLPEGRAFIISVSDEGMMLSMFGRDLVSHLAHISAVLNIKVTPPPLLTVETGEDLV